MFTAHVTVSASASLLSMAEGHSPVPTGLVCGHRQLLDTRLCACAAVGRVQVLRGRVSAPGCVPARELLGRVETSHPFCLVDNFLFFGSGRHELVTPLRNCQMVFQSGRLALQSREQSPTPAGPLCCPAPWAGEVACPCGYESFPCGHCQVCHVLVGALLSLKKSVFTYFVLCLVGSVVLLSLSFVRVLYILDTSPLSGTQLAEVILNFSYFLTTCF